MKYMHTMHRKSRKLTVCKNKLNNEQRTIINDLPIDLQPAVSKQQLAICNCQLTPVLCTHNFVKKEAFQTPAKGDHNPQV
jgi:hypothetical protein